MLRVASSVDAPTTITLEIQSVILGVSLTDVTAVNAAVVRRDGTTDTWAFDIVSATESQMVAQHTFASGEVTVTGVYNLGPILTVPGGTVNTTSVALFVSPPTNIAPRIEESVYTLGQVSVLSLGPTKTGWAHVDATDSPYEAIATSPFIAVDLSTGSVSVALWSGANGDAAVLSMYHATGNDLTLTTTGGDVIFKSGTSASSQTYADNVQVRLKMLDGSWIPW